MKATILYKLHQIARLRLFSGMKDHAVATLVGLSSSGLSRIIALPEYQEVEQRLLEGGIDKLDEALAGKQEEMRKVFAPAVPAAMQTLLEAVKQRKDLRTAVAAAVEVLDRDPDKTFAKASKAEGAVSRVPIPSGVLGQAIAATKEVANAVASAIPKVVQTPDTNSN